MRDDQTAKAVCRTKVALLHLHIAYYFPRKVLNAPFSNLVAEGGFEPPKLSRQIYSLIPLAARESRLHIVPFKSCRTLLLPIKANKISKFTQNWSWREESNPRPADYKSAALPTELRQHLYKRCAILVKLETISNLIWGFFQFFYGIIA